ncbi:MAG: two-component system, chemotaxis family, CheB/CheR fusion protein [bacterium]
MTRQATAGDTLLEVLLDYLKQSRGFDFTGYKRASLERRLRKRMEVVGAGDYGDYLDHLEVHQDEFPALFDTILINVTDFFRDPPTWQYFTEEVLPQLLAAIERDDPIRVWCAGCASGQETFTMAMVLAEALGEEDYMRRVKIYATEVDEDALNHARLASYSPKQVESIPPQLLDRYFARGDQRYLFRKDLRRTVIFGRNDLTQDAPISRIDLLTCRNTLMYFNAETQARILNRFHFALNPWGYLLLGKSEMLTSHSDLFRPVNLRRRVFAKVAKPTLRDRLLTFSHGPHESDDGPITEVRDAAFDTGGAGQVVVDPAGVVILANAHARAMFGLSPSDLGRPLKDLELSFRPVDLRSNLELAHTEGRTVSLGRVTSAPASGDPRELEVHITPLRAGERVLGASIIYHDVTRQGQVELELEGSKRELGSAYEELQSTVEELETTNEELQSTNEELETTNEELQSANEELETMNEELQSTNEELETINDELRERSHEFTEVNAFLETILSSMGVGVVVVDRDQRVQVWNAESAELWGVRADEATGRHLFGLDIGLPFDGVRGALRRVLADGDERAEVVVEALNRRGRSLTLQVTCVPLGVVPGDVTGAILLTAPMGGDGAALMGGDGAALRDGDGAALMDGDGAGPMDGDGAGPMDRDGAGP